MYVDKCKLCINMNLNCIDRNEVQCSVKEKHHDVLITHITPSKEFKNIPWIYLLWLISNENLFAKSNSDVYVQ